MVQPCVQVLANPSCDLQEGPEITREQLREKGIRPYCEKVHLPAVSQPQVECINVTMQQSQACSSQSTMMSSASRLDLLSL